MVLFVKVLILLQYKNTLNRCFLLPSTSVCLLVLHAVQSYSCFRVSKCSCSRLLLNAVSCSLIWFTCSQCLPRVPSIHPSFTTVSASFVNQLIHLHQKVWVFSSARKIVYTPHCLLVFLSLDQICPCFLVYQIYPLLYFQIKLLFSGFFCMRVYLCYLAPCLPL